MGCKIFVRSDGGKISGGFESSESAGGLSVLLDGAVHNFCLLGGDSGECAHDSGAILKFFSAALEEKKPVQVLKEFYSVAGGGYAVVLATEGALFAFRDFLGIKPLWFGRKNESFAISSDPQALKGIGLVPVALLPGHLLEFSAAGLSTKKAFDLNDFRLTVPKGHSIEKLRKEFEVALEMQCSGLEKAAVLFSGGVDSSLVAKAVSQKVPSTKLFVAGVEGSHDLAVAEESAKELGLTLEKIVLSEKDVLALADESASILSFSDSMQIGLSVPELACARKISEGGFRVVFSGQGSDEIFCGYTNYLKVLGEKGFDGVEGELWLSLERMWSRNFCRDNAILSSCSLEARMPFMEIGFLREAMAFPASEKMLSVSDPLRKHPVRELAKLYGLPDSIALQPKKAMQYGSGVQKIVLKMFSRRKSGELVSS
ncbi:Amidophosphoribosyltransferase [uncultured archaeon]|nr:Amidophosphoribosyltransferase [uncultured archaeon]